MDDGFTTRATARVPRVDRPPSSVPIRQADAARATSAVAFGVAAPTPATA